MISPDTLKKIDAYWAGYFGCKEADLNGKKTQVFTHAALGSFDGALAFRRKDACIVSVPATTPDIERSKLRAEKPADAFNAAFLAKTYVISTDKVTGPAWVGFADQGGFKPVKSDARILTSKDEAAMRELAEGCGETAWKLSKIAVERQTNFGLFVKSKLVAASGYLNLAGQLAYIGVITHPAHRGKGYARMVASASMAHALEFGLLPMWRTLDAHESAVKLAGALGFDKYASTLDVQLTEDEF
ncbi:MAG: GNAT family N-acetyltransferase [Planctomycetaceae bacterium]|nr:GNAT family N-acetyltransferase [Planctomycetaceae bacterium]